MVRDDDLIREILLQVEAWPPNAKCWLQIDDRDEQEIMEHLELLDEAGLLESDIMHIKHHSRRMAKAVPKLITWAGHEFIKECQE